jgi:(2Fe-2S) ferredoxin
VSARRFPPAAERCAVRADARGDDMLGTAFPAARLLLVEQPFPWGPDGLRTSRFDGTTALAVEARARAEGIRVQAIRRMGRAPDPAHRRWILADTRDGGRSLRCGEFAEDAELLELPLDGSHGAPDSEPLYLVCTHGRHDPCCAARGRPLLAAMAAVRPDRVWQASHLGGCRFAPTVLVLPLGLMYGRVPPSAASEIVASSEAGEVAGEYLRGRIGMAPAAQAAMAQALDHLGLRRMDDLSLVSTTTIDGAIVRVVIDGPQELLAVTVRRVRVNASGLTCAARGPGAFIAHRPVEIERVG